MHILISGFVKVADSEGRFGKQITKLLSRFRTTGYDHLRRYGCSIGIEDFELYAGSIPLPSSPGFRTGHSAAALSVPVYKSSYRVHPDGNGFVVLSP